MLEFEQIYKAYFGDVYLYILSLSNDKEIAEDITSETFFKVMPKLNSFRGECDIRTWLCQIARNTYFTYCKKEKRVTNIEAIDEVVNTSNHQLSMDEKVIRENDVLELHHTLHQLNEPYKEVFMLRVFGELSFQQIAKIFGKTDNWACVTYHRARNKIKNQREGHVDDQ